ncbi:MAG: nuclear transport factor 2 family protein [Solirubrobacterales bacterium]
MTPQATLPEQAWAHKTGKIDLGPQRPIPAASDPLDRLAIAEAFSRFGIAHDEARLDILATCFTADAVLEVVEGSAEPLALMEGREAILAGIGSVITQQQDQRRHCMANVVIDRLDGEEARALAYGFVSVAADGLSLGASVVYSGDLRREADGAWRFTRFLIGMDNYAGQKPEPNA